MLDNRAEFVVHDCWEDALAVDSAQKLEALPLVLGEFTHQDPARLEAQRRLLVQCVHGPQPRLVGGVDLHPQGWLGEPRVMRGVKHGQDNLAMLGPVVSCAVAGAAP